MEMQLVGEKQLVCQMILMAGRRALPIFTQGEYKLCKNKIKSTALSK